MFRSTLSMLAYLVTLTVSVLFISLTVGCQAFFGMSRAESAEPLASIPAKTPSKEISASSSKSTTPADPTLALQVGFSDIHIAEATTKGATLVGIHEAEVNNQIYTAFFLNRNSKPQVLNEFGYTILIYKGQIDSIKEFIYQIELFKALDANLIESLPRSTGLVNESPFFDPVLIAYEVAGFKLRSVKTSLDKAQVNYTALLVYLNDFYEVLTFEGVSKTSYRYLMSFTFPEPHFQDSDPKERARANNFVEEIFYGNLLEEAWNAAYSDFQPQNIVEKALFAIGCNFSRGTEIELADSFKLRAQSAFAEEQSYANHHYILYACTLLTDYMRLGEEQYNNFVAVFAVDNGIYRKLWNKLYSGTAYSAWDDANSDQVPDIFIDLTDRVLATSGYLDLGQDLIQVASNGNLIDLLYNVESPDYVIGDEGLLLTDLDGDKVKEIIESKSLTWSAFYDSKFFGGWWQAITRIYKSEDDFSYFPAEKEFEITCHQALDDLASRKAPDLFVRSGTRYDPNNHVMHAAAALATCDTVGMRAEGVDTFMKETEIEQYNESCHKSLNSIRAYIKYISGIDKPIIEQITGANSSTFFNGENQLNWLPQCDWR